MTEEERIKQVLYDFEEGGLVDKDIGKVLRCVSDRVIGIGIGEQGFVCSHGDIRAVLDSEVREKDAAVYSLNYDRIELLVHEGGFANVCADICIVREENGNVSRSRLLQSLVLVKEGGEWKICGLHASAPALTMEEVTAYPLQYAQETLQDMRAKIGEEVYQAEEQYRRAVLSDTVAFYIVNFTADRFEQCQLNGDLCVYAEPGTPYNEFVKKNLPDYVVFEDRGQFLATFSLDSIRKAIGERKKELSCEYRYLCPDGSAVWMVTVVRLITDCVTGENKGIMYVKDIDQQKRREIEMKNRAERDVMTGLYNKAAFIRRVEKRLSTSPEISAVFMMLDVDNFKTVNDTFGHPFGDYVLTETARMLREDFGEAAVVGRLGGDEFGIFCAGGMTREQAQKCFDKLQERLRNFPAPSGAPMRLSCSAGATGWGSAVCFHQAYQQADEALYRSKREGRSRCSFYEKALGEASHEPGTGHT